MKNTFINIRVISSRTHPTKKYGFNVAKQKYGNRWSKSVGAKIRKVPKFGNKNPVRAATAAVVAAATPEGKEKAASRTNESQRKYALHCNCAAWMRKSYTSELAHARIASYECNVSHRFCSECVCKCVHNLSYVYDSHLWDAMPS